MDGGHPYTTKVDPFPSGQYNYYAPFRCDHYTITRRNLIDMFTRYLMEVWGELASRDIA